MKKRNTFRNALLAGAAGLSLISLSSCNDDNTSQPLDTSLYGVVSRTSDLSVLTRGIDDAGLRSTLQGTGPFTVFGPTNDAFAAIGVNTSNIGTVSGLNNLLLYHTLPANIPAASVPAGPNAKVITASGDSVFVTRNASGVYVNGIKVATADVLANNGVAHTIPTVLMPAKGNIVQVAQADTTFKLLVQAVVKCNLQGALSTTTPLTVFAPTNAAFRAAGFDSTAIANASPATVTALTNVLTYHVIPARVFSSDLSEGLQPTMLNGAKTTITLGGGAKVKGITNTVASNIVATNVLARNGVVHVIDRVLLP